TVWQEFLLGIENQFERAFLQRQDVDRIGAVLDTGRVADDIDQAIRCVKATEQIIVLAIGTREERREMREAGAFQCPGRARLAEGRHCAGSMRESNLSTSSVPASRSISAARRSISALSLSVCSSTKRRAYSGSCFACAAVGAIGNRLSAIVRVDALKKSADS